MQQKYNKKMIKYKCFFFLYKRKETIDKIKTKKNKYNNNKINKHTVVKTPITIIFRIEQTKTKI